MVPPSDSRYNFIGHSQECQNAIKISHDSSEFIMDRAGWGSRVSVGQIGLRVGNGSRRNEVSRQALAA